MNTLVLSEETGFRRGWQSASVSILQNTAHYATSKNSPEIIRLTVVFVCPLPTHLAIVGLELNVCFGLKADIQSKLRAAPEEPASLLAPL